jgi:quercetin dioxygenase-like cupin family protein
MSPVSGTGSERAQVASVCYEEAARAPWHREARMEMLP